MDTLQRSKRPQPPIVTHPGLPVHATTEAAKEVTAPPLPGKRAQVKDEDPWQRYEVLGELVQKRVRHRVCRTATAMIMFKESDIEQGQDEFAILRDLSHPNILQLRDCFCNENKFFLGLEWIQITLRELLLVEPRMEGSQIQHIARSMFSAIQYVASNGVVHQRISLQSIRVCYRTGQVKLGDFQNSVKQHPGPVSGTTDLEALGIVLLCCMDKNIEGISLSSVKANRQAHKLYGVRDAEIWSKEKTLIDFLEEIFNAGSSRKTTSALAKKHKYLEDDSNGQSLDAFISLVLLAVSTIWHSEPT